MSDGEWDTVINVNLRGAWLGCQIVIPHLQATRGRAIVNLSSESRWGTFGQSHYAAAKAGLVGLTRTVAIEHARHKIQANAVAPGATLTGMVLEVPEDIRSGCLKTIPMNRMAKPSESLPP
jgi:3-oxoacyl-[acyl-carrier protein] reductase